MSVESIRQEINQYEATIKRRLQVLAQLRVSIIADVKPCMKEMLKENIEKQVRNNPDHTQALGRETLGEMKAKLGVLIETSDSIVDAIFANNELWMHIDYEKTMSPNSYCNAGQSEQNMRDGVGAILDKADDLLVEYKYIKKPSASFSTSRAIPAYWFSLPKPLLDKIKKYRTDIEALHNDLSKLSGLKKDLAKQEASDLWEQV